MSGRAWPGDIERPWPDAVVLEAAGSDYRFRAFLPREQVVALIAERLGSIDYGNFKDQRAAA